MKVIQAELLLQENIFLVPHRTMIVRRATVILLQPKYTLQSPWEIKIGLLTD